MSSSAIQAENAASEAILDARERRKRRREVTALALLAALFVILTVAEFRLTRLSSTLPFVNSIFFFGLLNINLVLLIGMVWLVARNVGKLFIERRQRILGSRLKTKLVIAFLAFSIIPTLALFIISALYINSSFDKWFSIKIQNTLQASLEITHTYYRNTDQTAMHFAEHIAKGIGRHMASRSLNEVEGEAAPERWVGSYLEAQRELLALDAVEFYRDPILERDMAQRSPSPAGGGDYHRAYPRLSLDLLDKAFGGERVSVMQHVGTGDLIRCMVPVRIGSNGPVAGVLVVDSFIPVSLVNKVDEIASVIDDYKDTNPLKYPMKTTYLVILIMITLVILIVAIWVGLYMARELTVPVERLVKGAEAVGAGDLDVTVKPTGHDEISVLIESFNRMTHDLRESRSRLLETGADLERRRLQLEAVLGNIGTGVISIGPQGQITTFNPSASRLLGISPTQAMGNNYSEALSDEGQPLKEALDRAFQSARAPETVQWNHRREDGVHVLTAVVTPLRDAENDWGQVVVIDDMTLLIKGQREMAWREVARRIAHEIKNPLTPIKLSAQRLQRRLGDYRGRDGAILQECTDTIIKHTDELKEMVNEFSSFARFPEVSPTPSDLNEAVAEVVRLYQQAHSDIQFRLDAEPKIPIFEFDRDQIKRVMINLLDNGVAALKSVSPEGRSARKLFIGIATHFNEDLRMAVIQVEDNGPGMSEEVMDRVFEPYFSTKAEGTGLGLAIAKRIVNDHDGFIRVHSTLGQGTRFLIELPTSVRHGADRDLRR